MAQQRASAKLQRTAARTGRKASAKAGGENGARAAATSKSDRNGSSNLSADELMLRVWKKTYENHHRREKDRV
jgi:hypothetical protein